MCFADTWLSWRNGRRVVEVGMEKSQLVGDESTTEAPPRSPSCVTGSEVGDEMGPEMKTVLIEADMTS